MMQRAEASARSTYRVVGYARPDVFFPAPFPPHEALVVPDTLSIDPSAPAGFPNGRGLADPVIDVTLSVILLELTSGVCGDGACSPVTLVGLNPPANDVEFLEDFPYLAPPATP